MNRPIFRGCTALLVIFGPFSMASAYEHELEIMIGRSDISTDATGLIQTVNANGKTDTRGAFFQSLGTNGRSCSTCHVADQAMSISPPQIRERFSETRGRDPLFASVDGANCATARTGDAAAHSLLLSH